MRFTNIIGDQVILRVMEPEDLDIMYIWENDPSLWGVSDTRIPYSRYQLMQFVENQPQDLSCTGQLRLVICKRQEQQIGGGDVVVCPGDPIGAVDIFDYESLHRRAGVGILLDPVYRGQGYATDALVALERYLSEVLDLHQVWCNVSEDNLSSLKLFKSRGFEVVGVKRDWCRRGKEYVNEIFLQKII